MHQSAFFLFIALHVNECRRQPTPRCFMRTREYRSKQSRCDARVNIGSESTCRTLRWDGMKMLSLANGDLGIILLRIRDQNDDP